MSEAAVSRIAIAIFALVISTVINGWLTLGVTVGVVIIVLDQIGWGGRGSNLVGALLEARSLEYRERVLHHEAGHLLAACVLNIPVVDYVLDPWLAFRRGYPGYGGVQLDLGPWQTWLEHHQISESDLERYGIFWAAGGVAEQQVWGQAQGDRSDQRQIAQLLALLRTRFGAGLDLKHWQSRFKLGAEELLQTHPEAYELVVQRMRQRLPVQECVAEINQVLSSRVVISTPGSSGSGWATE